MLIVLLHCDIILSSYKIDHEISKQLKLFVIIISLLGPWLASEQYEVLRRDASAVLATTPRIWDLFQLSLNWLVFAH